MRDKEKHKVVSHQHYLRNAGEIKRRSRERSDCHLDFVRGFLAGYKSFVGCRRCPVTDFRVLDFHHLDGKVKAISEMRYHSLLSILREAEKCIVLCSNCHRIETYEANHKLNN